MGERLNIEIKNNGEVLANAYYHWSGYTSSTLELVQTILDNLTKYDKDNLILYAIRLLEETGAGLMDNEKEYFNKNNIECDFSECISRNNGLISISPKGIEETEYWEEHRAEINIDTKNVSFKRLVWSMSKDEYIEDYEDDEEETKFNDLPVLDININSISFDKFDKFKKEVLNLIEQKIYHIRLKNNENEVFGFVE